LADGRADVGSRRLIVAVVEVAVEIDDIHVTGAARASALTLLDRRVDDERLLVVLVVAKRTRSIKVRGCGVLVDGEVESKSLTKIHDVGFLIRREFVGATAPIEY